MQLEIFSDEKTILGLALCLSLTARETVNDLDWPDLSTLNPFGGKDTVQTVDIENNANRQVSSSNIETEMNEMAMLTGQTVRLIGIAPKLKRLQRF